MRPPYMLRCPRSLPLSKSYGARPTRAAICLRLMRPSSGSRAMRVKASTGPTPGIEVRRVTPREIGLGGDRLGEALLEEADIGLDPRQTALGKAPEHGVLKLCGLVFDCDVLVTELAPHGDDLGDSGGGRVMAHDVRGHGRDILGDQPGI